MMRQGLRIAHKRLHLIAARQRLIDHQAAGAACGADNGDFNDYFPCVVIKK